MKTRHPFGQLFATGFNIPTPDSAGFTVRKYGYGYMDMERKY